MIIVTLLCRISIKDKYQVGGLVVTPLHKTNRALGLNPLFTRAMFQTHDETRVHARQPVQMVSQRQEETDNQPEQ